MSIVLETLSIPRGWSKAYIEQLAIYVRQRDIEGYSFGNRKLFEKRHKEILEWIEYYEEYCDDHSVKFKAKEAK
jgi:hypothetical protein